MSHYHCCPILIQDLQQQVSQIYNLLHKESQAFNFWNLTPTALHDSPEFLYRMRAQTVDPKPFSTCHLGFCRFALFYLFSRLKHPTLRNMEGTEHPLTMPSLHLSISTVPFLRWQSRTARHVQDTF